MILIDSVYIKDKKYYGQVFLEKYKHFVRKKGHIFFYLDDSDEKTQMKTITYINLFLEETRIT